MDDLGLVLTIVVSIIAVAAALGGAFYVFRSRGVKETMDVMTVANEEMRKILKQDREECDRKILEVQEENKREITAIQEKHRVSDDQQTRELSELRGVVATLQGTVVKELVGAFKEAIEEIRNATD